MPRKAPKFVVFEGIAYRATSYDVPLWVNPNRRSGRWNIAHARPTQYLCLDAEGPFAEVLRHEGLRTEEAASHYSTTIWQVRVSEGAIVDYRTFERAEAAGFDPDALVSDDHERCQAEAEWLVSKGATGILTPSAALSDSVDLTLFGARVRIPWGSTAELASAVPAQRLTTGAPPRGLADRVRHFGDPDPLLEAHLARVGRLRRGGRPHK
ncbi:MAG: RES domain-containing protein [Solirubrobacteraceae bacterium]